MSLTPLVTTLVVPSLSETATHEPAVDPIFVGIGVFLLLAAMLFGLLMFGAGRDHS